MTRFDPASGLRWEPLLAAAILVLRLLSADPSRIWRDWVVVLSGFWIYTSFREGSAEWPVVATTAMAYLLGIHVLGQIPHVLAVLALAA